MSDDVETALKEGQEFGPEALMGGAVLYAMEEVADGDGPGPGVRDLVTMHETSTPAHAQLLDSTLRDWLMSGIESSWRAGWTPLDLERRMRRRAGALAAAILVDCMAARLWPTAADSAHAPFLQQLVALGADPTAADELHFVEDRARISDTDTFAVIHALVRLLAAFHTLPPPAIQTDETMAVA